MPSEFDDREFPIVRMRAFGISADSDIEERMAFLDRQLARGPTFALVFDTRRSALLSAAHRRMWGAWVAKNEQLLAQRAAGCAVLVGSAAGRGVFTAICWIWQPPIPLIFVGTDDEAEGVVRRMLAAETGIDAR